MCGFTGYYYFDNRQENDNKAILKMLALQEHRGPDDSGITGINTISGQFQNITIQENKNFDTPVNLVYGFNRLSILDLSPNGHQPMISPDQNVVLMMNGEVYNAFDFKDELIAKGYHFKSTCDTEVVLHLYSEYGMDAMISRLNGMFALAIYDFNLKTLFLARDRFGIKPLYILNEDGRIAFSSEMKSFKALPGFKFEADFDKIDEFLLFRNVINHTLFKNIKNCTPGTYIAISTDGNIKSKEYYNINDEGNQPLNDNEAKVILENVLKQSVKSQMISDVKLGCQLSGGVDSSLVTSYAADNLDSGNLETISITFKDPRFSEEKYIDQVAEKLSLKAHKYEMDASYYFNVMEKAIWHFEQPLNHPNTIGIYLLSQEAKKHVTVLLSGEGADESLAGYSRFIKAIQSPFLNRNFFAELKRNKRNCIEFLKYYSDPNLRMIMGSSFGSIATARALKSNFSLNDALKDRNKIIKLLKGDTTLKQRKYELLTYLPDLLMRQDKMSMAHSIENRVPFLDNELVSKALNLPSHLLIGKHNGKIEAKVILKEICASRFNEAFAFRDKMGFGIPLKSFMSSDDFQKRWKNELLPKIEKRGIFNYQPLQKWMENPKIMTAEQTDAVWLMVGFEIWAKQYLD